MKLSKKDKIISNCKKFIDGINENFTDVEDVSIVILSTEPDEYNEKYSFNPKNEVYPLKVTIISESKTKRYAFITKNECDDEYPIKSKYGESMGYWEFKEYIKQNLKEVFTKSAFKETIIINSDNIELLYSEVCKKEIAINLNQELNNSKNPIKRQKI